MSAKKGATEDKTSEKVSDKPKKIAVTVHFLLPKGKTEDTCSEDLVDAFDQVKEHKMTPIWVEEDKALKITPSKSVSIANSAIILAGIICIIKIKSDLKRANKS